MNGIQHPAAFNAMQATLSLRNFPIVNEKIVDEEVFLMCLYADEEAEKDMLANFRIYFGSDGILIL